MSVQIKSHQRTPELGYDHDLLMVGPLTIKLGTLMYHGERNIYCEMMDIHSFTCSFPKTLHQDSAWELGV